MLSVVDLIEAGTVSRELAGYTAAAIGRGASFLVGAVPGGAGKTTVMGALLNLVPADVELRAADGMRAIRTGLDAPRPRACYLCHEIGSGPYYAYLWGAELRAYFELPGAGHILATNLHADTYDQAREQICGENGVSEQHLRRMHLMFFLEVGGWGRGANRRIVSAWESDGEGGHRQVFDVDTGLDVAASSLVSPDALSAGRERIERVLTSGAKTIQEVRAAVLAAAAEGETA